MRIAVIADTHDRVPPGLADRLSGADEVWHLGDVCSPEMLAGFERAGRPLVVVRGNCDWNEAWPVSLTLERMGRRFHLVHVPPLRPPARVGFVLHGHTHVPRDEDIGGVRWLNPGCVTRPNRGAPPSFAWLNLDSD